MLAEGQRSRGAEEQRYRFLITILLFSSAPFLLRTIPR
jgi:hypothetical protein